MPGGTPDSAWMEHYTHAHMCTQTHTYSDVPSCRPREVGSIQSCPCHLHMLPVESGTLVSFLTPTPSSATLPTSKMSCSAMRVFP